jgi:hypothetical protein
MLSIAEVKDQSDWSPGWPAMVLFFSKRKSTKPVLFSRLATPRKTIASIHSVGFRSFERFLGMLTSLQQNRLASEFGQISYPPITWDILGLHRRMLNAEGGGRGALSIVLLLSKGKVNRVDLP